MSSSKHLKEQYELLSEKIQRLKMALIVEAGEAVRFQLEKQIESAEAERDRIVRQLEGVDQLAVTCPYRGLFAFREQDERFFFGRDTYIEQLFKAVQTNPLVALIGASGSGKSSVVYAGLIPRLRRIPSSEGWGIAAFRPGENPFQAVSQVLVPFLYSDELDRISNVKKLTKQLYADEIGLCDVIARIVEKDEHAEKFLLFADQFEELYTLCHDENECRRFLDVLLEIQNVSCKLLLTMRADFLGKALSYRPFADAFQNSNILLGPMNHEEIRATIEEPAKMLDVTIEDGLTDRILAAVGEKPGNLPLLEFALSELWKKQNNGILTHAAYEKIGGVEKALTRHADQEFEHLSAAEQARVQRIFTQLFRPGEGTEDTRRIATRADIGEGNWELVAKLADARLVVTGTPIFPSQEGNIGVDSQTEKQKDTVEVVHESLITGWQRLREWIDADREFRTWQERLRFTLHQWLSNQRDEGVLLRGAPLTEAEEWLGKRRADLSQEEQHFIEASQAWRDKEIAERKARRQQELEAARELAEEQRQRAEEQTKAAKKLRSRLILALILAVIAVGAAIVALYGFRQAQEKTALAEDKTRLAKQEQERAQQESDKAKRSEIAALHQSSKALFLAHDELGALLAGIKAGKMSSQMSGSERLKDQIRANLQTVVDGIHEKNRLEGHTAPVESVAFSPDGTLLASGSRDNTIKLWNLKDGREIRTLHGHAGGVRSIAFSPDGTLARLGK